MGLTTVSVLTLSLDLAILILRGGPALVYLLATSNTALNTGFPLTLLALFFATSALSVHGKAQITRNSFLAALICETIGILLSIAFCTYNSLIKRSPTDPWRNYAIAIPWFLFIVPSVVCFPYFLYLYFAADWYTQEPIALLLDDDEESVDVEPYSDGPGHEEGPLAEAYRLQEEESRASSPHDMVGSQETGDLVSAMSGPSSMSVERERGSEERDTLLSPQPATSQSAPHETPLSLLNPPRWARHQPLTRFRPRITAGGPNEIGFEIFLVGCALVHPVFDAIATIIPLQYLSARNEILLWYDYIWLGLPILSFTTLILLCIEAMKIGPIPPRVFKVLVGVSAAIRILFIITFPILAYEKNKIIDNYTWRPGFVLLIYFRDSSVFFHALVLSNFRTETLQEDENIPSGSIRLGRARIPGSMPDSSESVERRHQQGEARRGRGRAARRRREGTQESQREEPESQRQAQRERQEREERREAARKRLKKWQERGWRVGTAIGTFVREKLIPALAYPIVQIFKGFYACADELADFRDRQLRERRERASIRLG